MHQVRKELQQCLNPTWDTYGQPLVNQLPFFVLYNCRDGLYIAVNQRIRSLRTQRVHFSPHLPFPKPVSHMMGSLNKQALNECCGSSSRQGRAVHNDALTFSLPISHLPQSHLGTFNSTTGMLHSTQVIQQPKSRRTSLPHLSNQIFSFVRDLFLLHCHQRASNRPLCCSEKSRV